MATDWNYTTGSFTYEEWYRSGQQLIQCPPGQSPTLTASVEKIRKYSNGDVIVETQPSISLELSSMTGDDL